MVCINGVFGMLQRCWRAHRARHRERHQRRFGISSHRAYQQTQKRRKRHDRQRRGVAGENVYHGGSQQRVASGVALTKENIIMRS